MHAGPYLNEFVIRVPDARLTHGRLLDRGILAGLVLADAEPDDPSLADGLLVCATELTTAEEIDRFAEALGDVLNGNSPQPVAAGVGADSGSAAGSAR
jgi:glycine dehydrogenase subunit 1